MKRLFCIVLSLLFLSGCAPASVKDEETLQFFAMDTVMSVTVSDGDNGAAGAVQTLIYDLDEALSRTQENSEIALLNNSAGTGNSVALSETILDLLKSAVSLSERTNGAFNPAIAPIMDAWGFTKDKKHVPSDEELQKLLPLLNLDSLELENGKALLSVKGMSLDLGAIAKGYAGDKAIALLGEFGVSSALVSLGGNITAIGTKPDGSGWRVAVRDPNDQEGYLGVLTLTDKTVSTSGGYERFFEQDGVIYHHIIDPKTGYPALSGLQSVSIVSASGTVADALSTALFVMGEENALALWRGSDDFEAVLVRDDGKVLVTEGLENIFEFLGDSNGYTYEIIRR